MKKIIVASFAILALAACGGNDSGKDGKKEESKENAGSPDASSDPNYQKLLDVVGKSDCFTCHAISETKIGPTYMDVANKYADKGDSAVHYLVDKIKNGGTGVWGQTPMTPHPQLSDEDIREMVKYILLLKK